MRYVAYYRVSTTKQGASGLGLEAQRKAVLHEIGSGTLLAEFTEIESGKLNTRPKLEKALRHCRVTGATLIVAKLDRLSRNAAFLNMLSDSKLSFVCCDMPFADELTIGIMAQLAQWEAKQISKRTKDALEAAKVRGQRLGGKRAGQPCVSVVGAERSIQVRKAQAASRHADMMHYVSDARDAGHTTLTGIAAYFNSIQLPTPRGGTWYAASVSRLLCYNSCP